MDRRSGLIAVGTAGWSIPKAEAHRFAPTASHLARYASRLPAVEINSSFYRPHRPSTYARWAATVPDGFRFAVKLPKAITHERRLADASDALERFLAEAGALGNRLGPLLVQLPPSLPFEPAVAKIFLGALRDRFAGDVVWEPRHASWFSPEADRDLAAFRVARVAADPAPAPGADEPGGWPGLAYYRLHGSPRIYYSPYGPERLDALVRTLSAQASRGAAAWCIFDNTALGAATADALGTLERLTGSPGSPGSHERPAEADRDLRGRRRLPGEG